MGTIKIAVDPRRAVLAGRLASGEQLLQVSDEQIAALTAEQRETLAAHLSRTDPPALQDTDGHGGVGCGLRSIAGASWDSVVEYLEEIKAERAAAAAEDAERDKRKRARLDKAVEMVHRDWRVLLAERHLPEHYSITHVEVSGSINPLPTQADDNLLEDPRIAEQVALARAEEQRSKEAAEAERVNAQAAREQRRAAEQAAKAVQLAERDRWIAERGSERLRRAVSLGLGDTIWSSYREERLAADMPGWRHETRDEDRDAPREPTVEALAALEEARKKWPSVELIWLKSYSGGGCEALGAEHLDKLVVYEISGGRDTRRDSDDDSDDDE